MTKKYFKQPSRHEKRVMKNNPFYVAPIPQLGFTHYKNYRPISPVGSKSKFEDYAMYRVNFNFRPIRRHPLAGIDY